MCNKLSAVSCWCACLSLCVSLFDCLSACVCVKQPDCQCERTIGSPGLHVSGCWLKWGEREIVGRKSGFFIDFPRVEINTGFGRMKKLRNWSGNWATVIWLDFEIFSCESSSIDLFGSPGSDFGFHRRFASLIYKTWKIGNYNFLTLWPSRCFIFSTRERGQLGKSQKNPDFLPTIFNYTLV